MKPARIALVCLLVAAAAPATVSAQPSARDREAAADAYDRGTAAYLADDFEHAAQWFETAHRLAPAAAALVQAVRSHQRAGNATRAATLALRLEELYPDDPAAARTAAAALESAGDLVRVDVECDEECSLEVGGAIVGARSFFITPGEAHEVVASFETGNRTETVEGAAGETRSLRFEAPEAAAPDPSTTDLGPATPGDEEPGGGGVPLGVTIASIGVTAALGGVLIWSGVDTLDGVPAYEAAPTAEGLADGRAREERTNWLIAGTSVAAALSAALLIFTDFGGEDEPSTEPAEGEVSAEALLGIQPGGVVAGLRGRY